MIREGERKMDRFHEIEIEKLYDAILSIENLRLQVGIFFATINLGVLSIAANQEKSIFFFFGAILLWIMLPIDLTARKVLAGHYYRVLYLHKKYVKNDDDYSPNRFSRLAKEVLRILNLPKGQDKNTELINVPGRIRNNIGFWFPISASLVEIILGVVLWKYAGWALF